MATSSFNKNYTLDSKRAVDSFLSIVSAPPKSVEIKRDIVSPENEMRGEERLKQILSR